MGSPLCPRCGKAPEGYEDAEWRRKFNEFAKITEALVRFEKSDPSVTLRIVSEIKGLAKGLFEFNNVGEMYLGYHKLMTELGADTEDSGQSLKDEWRAVIDDLFEKAKRENLEEYIRFIFSPDSLQIRQIEDTIRESQIAVARAEKDYFLSKISDYPIFVRPLTREGIEESRIRFSLLLYSHLSELDDIYNLTMNMIRVSKGENFEGKPFPKSKKYPRQKIRLISKENSQIGKIFEEFWSGPVRNAFAHSKYKIEEGLFIKTDEDFSIPLADLQAKIDLCKGYWRYLYRKIAKEEAFALEKKVFFMRDGSTIVISGRELPPDT